MGALALGGLRLVALGLGGSAIIDKGLAWLTGNAATTTTGPSQAPTAAAPAGGLTVSPLLLVGLAAGGYYLVAGKRRGRGWR